MKNAYIVLLHTHVPVTEGPHKGKFQVHEVIEFVDALRDKHLTKSTAILDVLKRKVIKNRAKESGATYELLEQHIIKGYRDKYKEFLELVGAEVPAELMKKEKENEEGNDGRETEEADSEGPAETVAPEAVEQLDDKVTTE